MSHSLLQGTLFLSAGVTPLNWGPQRTTEGQALGGTGRGRNGRHLKCAGGKQGPVPIWGLQAPSQLARDPRGTFLPNRRTNPPLAHVPSSPLCRSCCLFKGLPLPLSLLPPRLCRSRRCGSELHGETLLQVRFLGVWSVPSFPTPPPPSPSRWLPLPLPLPTEGAGGWAGTLYNAPCSLRAGRRGPWRRREAGEHC